MVFSLIVWFVEFFLQTHFMSFFDTNIAFSQYVNLGIREQDQYSLFKLTDIPSWE